MKIYTGFGDKGDTALFGGGKVRKNNIRVEVYGTLDELNSVIGLIRSFNKDDLVDKSLRHIQNELFVFGSEMATPDEKVREKFTEKVEMWHIKALEKTIDQLTEKMPGLKTFILPGGSQAAAFAHFGRTVCRRCERLLVASMNEIQPRNELIVYLNRLGDLLFTIARYENFIQQVNDIPWQGIGK